MAEVQPSVRCVSCTFETNKEHEMLNHVKEHLHQLNYRIPCMECPEKLLSMKTYRKHKKTCKRNIMVYQVQ